MKNFLLILTFIFTLLGAKKVTAAPGEPAKITFQGYETEGSSIGVVYSLPYPGMVEVRIFNQAGTLVWRNQYVREKGEHRLSLKKSSFKQELNYSLRINYKQDEFKQDLPKS